jgi:UDP-2,3-diacylglucosamine hydrolase
MSPEPWGAPGSLVFASDLHLDASQPERSQLFSTFLSRLGRPPRPATLYLLGDLFDVWLGRPSLRLEAHASVLNGLRTLADSGVEVCVLQGNRDFLLDGRFKERTGVRVVEEWLSIGLGPLRTYLCHGDRLAVADRAHQRMRWILRSRPARLVAASLPETALRGAARWLRRRSDAVQERRPPDVDGMPAIELARIFRGGYDVVIAGHVHQERRRAMVVDGRARQLYTLGAWEDGGSFLVFDGASFGFHAIGR